ncbi:MAG TPA: serine/threonine-protein kinase [Kofleriaceae bacterium]|nr:serine/threonine-protein kinase [Kofleriaceae bacterium]
MPYNDVFHPGSTLGKYEIVRELATGGMAQIYLAKVTGTAGFEKNVVLKCILPNLANDRQFVTMFLDEARLAATLRHSNIADVFDVGVEGKTYYFAMEYVAGQNARTVRLKAREAKRPIPIEISLAIVGGTAAALHYAHTRTDANGKSLDLVHRDVSPSNILVGYEGAIKLVDFGIARATSRRLRTRTGIRKGKVPYLSPELCRGHHIDHRSDLFSLGTILYELTTGERPFLGNSDFVVMDQIVTGTPLPPSSTTKGYLAGLEPIVMRLLARSPEARYQTAGQVLEDIETLASENRLLISSHIVAKFMKELFIDAGTAPFERDTYLDFAQPVVDDEKHADEEPTAAFSRAEQMWTAELKVKVRTPRRAQSEPGEEISITSAVFHEPTRQDVVPAFDPIDARSEEILIQLDAEAPDDESRDRRAHRRIITLIDRALEWVDSGELDKAVTAVELALDEDMSVPGTQDLLQDRVASIVAVYEAMLEDPYRVLELARPIDELAGVAMEIGARTLLAWIDGKTNIQQLLAHAEMPRLEAYHHLCQLLMRGMIR